MDLSVIIVNYKSLAKTEKCVKAVMNSDLEGLSFEIIVVENGSGDDAGSLKKNFPHIKIVNEPVNRGMGGGNNLGIRNSYGEDILILNPDTYLEPDAIKRMHRFLSENIEVGIAGPKLNNPDGTLQHSCLRFPKIFIPFLRRTKLGSFFKKSVDNFLMADFDHKTAREVDWIMGSCLMIKRNVLNKIGEAFDQRFFMFFEDTDLCRRTKRAGFKVIYLPEARAVHDHTRASARGKWYLAPFTNSLARSHIASWIKYFWKWKFKS